MNRAYLLIEGDVAEILHPQEFDALALIAYLGKYYDREVLDFVNSANVGEYKVLGMHYYIVVRIR